MLQRLNAINEKVIDVERAFNVAGSLPVVPRFSGALRANIAVIQTVAGSMLAIISTIAYAVENLKSRPSDELLAKMHLMQKFGAQHAIHGLLNIIRGLAEAALCALTADVGNVFTFLPFNLSMHRGNFHPYYTYDKNMAGRPSVAI